MYPETCGVPGGPDVAVDEVQRGVDCRSRSED